MDTGHPPVGPWVPHRSRPPPSMTTGTLWALPTPQWDRGHATGPSHPTVPWGRVPLTICARRYIWAWLAVRAGEAALPSSTACCAMPEAPGVTLCARFRSCAAAGDVARLICDGAAEKGWGATPDRRVDAGGMGARGDGGLTVGCCAGAGWAPFPPEEPLCLLAARLAWGKKPSVTRIAAPMGAPLGRGVPYLLDGGQALELGAGEVLLLERGRLQHQVLLLRRVHLLQVLRRRVGLPVQRLLDHLLGGANTSPGCTPTPKHHSVPSPPPRQTPLKCRYLDGLAVGDAAVDGDLGSGRAGGAGAAGCCGGAARAAGGRRCRELLVLHGGLPGRREAAGVRLELGGGEERVRGGTLKHPKVAPDVCPELRRRVMAGVPACLWGFCIPPLLCLGWG